MVGAWDAMVVDRSRYDNKDSDSSDDVHGGASDRYCYSTNSGISRENKLK